jgi:F0F1-type ATP synthase assembly protein I
VDLKKEDEPRGESPWVAVARYSEIGFIIPASVVLGFLLGKLLDYWFHSTWIYIGGIIVGAVIGFSQMIRRATASFKDQP